MLIKTRDSIFKYTTFRRNLILFLTFAIFALLLSIWSYQYLPFFGDIQAKSALSKEYSRVLVRYKQAGYDNWSELGRKALTENAFNFVDVPKININIDFNSWKKIQKSRNKMLGEVFMSPEKDYHKATIQFNGKTIPVKLRLKGERTDHINDPKKWSFRVKTKNGNSLFGMKSFSLQHPKTRSFQLEPLFHHFAKNFELLSLRFMFIDVSINGEDIGVMALEEHFAKELLEFDGKKEGHIFKFDDKNVTELYHATLKSLQATDPIKWKDERSLNKMYKGDYLRLKRVYYNSILAPFESYIDSDDSPFLENQLEVASGLMKGVLSGVVKPSELFDAQKTGQYFAYLTLWGSAHASSFRNARYYFNPYTYKLEPIAFDSNAYTTKVSPMRKIPYDQTVRDHEVDRILFSDDKIMESYKAEINKLYNTVMHSDFFEKFRLVESKYIGQLRNEFFLLPEMDIEKMKSDITQAYKEINNNNFFVKKKELINTENDPKPLSVPESFEPPEIVRAEIIETEDGKELSLINLLPMPVIVDNISFKVDGINKTHGAITDVDWPIRLEPQYYNSFLQSREFALKGVLQHQEVKVSGEVVLNNLNRYSFKSINSYPALDNHPLKNDAIFEIIENFKFISFDQETYGFTIPEGEWVIDKDLILPVGAYLTVNEGASLKIKKGVGIVVFGQLTLNGSIENPITMDSIDGTLDTAWSGITVLNSPQLSTISHSTIKNTDYASLPGWGLTGGVVFYKSSVDLKSVSFVNSNAEDALNIVKSTFSMRNCLISNARSDGFDGDFVSGIIVDSQFENIGGDGIDFSGSNIRAKNLKFDLIKDKAVSVGESSDLVAEKLSVYNSGTGVAVKDGSSALVEDSVFKSIGHKALMSYTKKNAYGGASLVANNVFLEGDSLLQVQSGSTMIVDGADIDVMDINIESLYKSGYMKK